MYNVGHNSYIVDTYSTVTVTGAEDTNKARPNVKRLEC